MSVFANIFAGTVKEMFKAAVAAELQVIKANNSPEFYERLVKATDNAFLLWQQATKNKTVKMATQVFTEPIEQAAQDDNITL